MAKAKEEKMKRRLQRIGAILLATSLMIASLTACGGSDDKGGSADNNGGNSVPASSTEVAAADDALTELTLPLCEEKQELTVWLVYNGTIVSDLNEVEGVKKMEELTNVHINWVPVNQDDIPTKYGTLIASGEYPDIIYAAYEYPGGFEKGIEDGVIYPDMDGLIRKYMPNYMRLVNSSEQARREALSDSGKFLIAKNIVGTFDTVEAEGNYLGLAYRADLLEKLGLDVPTTIDEWHNALTVAKQNGIENPFVLDQNGGSFLALSWGVTTTGLTFYTQLDGDKVVVGQATDNYKGYLDTMRQWYSEGLINPNFTSFHFYLSTPESVDKNETLLYSYVISSFTGSNYANYHMVNNTEEYLQPIVAPALNEGDVPIQSFQTIISKDPIYITTGCKNPELAAQWLDFQYSEQGTLLNWYGIEGETYEMVDGKPVYTDAVYASEGSVDDYLCKYALNKGMTWLGKHDISAGWQTSTKQAGGHNQELEAIAVWGSPETNICLTSSITLTDDESSEVTSYTTQLRTMIDEYTINYITGTTDETFEEYQQSLYDNGLQEVIDVYQAAYDRYLAR